MANFYKAEVIGEVSTTASDFQDVPGSEVTFTPGSASENWLVLLTGLASNSAGFECALNINGATRDIWGHTIFRDGEINFAPFFIFDLITGTSTTQTVKAQYRKLSGGTTIVKEVRLVVCQIPSGADVQYLSSDISVETTGASAEIANLTFTPSSAGNYACLYKVGHSELPSTNTSVVWFEDAAGQKRPEAPSGVHASNSKDSQVPISGICRNALTATPTTFRLRCTSSAGGVEPSTHTYRKILVFREDAFDYVGYAEDLGESSTTATTFQLKNSLTVPAPAGPADLVTVQALRISGDASGRARWRVASLRRDSVSLLTSNHAVDADSSAAGGYHAVAGLGDALSQSGPALLENGFLSPSAAVIRVAESTIFALRYPPVSGPQNAIFFGIAA